MYLETILVLSRQKSLVRAIDVGEHMGYSKPSVSRAIGLLKQGGFVTVDRDGHIALTDVGVEVAEKIYARHRLLTDFLIGLGVDEQTALDDACKMEHYISDQTYNAIKRLSEKM